MTIDFEKDQTEVLDKTTNINKLADKIKELQARPTTTSSPRGRNQTKEKRHRASIR